MLFPQDLATRESTLPLIQDLGEKLTLEEKSGTLRELLKIMP